MNKILITIVASISLILTACGEKRIDGVYESKGGKIGIYEMRTMEVQKMPSGSNYSVVFIGPEKTLKYENVEFKNGELQINDKGFLMPIKVDGDKATVVAEGVVFQKSKTTSSSASSQPAQQQVTNADPAAKVDFPAELMGKWVEGKGDKFCRDALNAEKQTGMWDGLIISKDGVSGMEFSCTAASVSKVGESFSIVENCAALGNEYKLNSAYIVSNGSLKINSEDENGQKSQAIYNTSCK
jgi:hypothetical protein